MTSRHCAWIKYAMAANATGAGASAWMEVKSKDRQRLARGMPVSKWWTTPVYVAFMASISPYKLLSDAAVQAHGNYMGMDWADRVETEENRVFELQQWP